MALKDATNITVPARVPFGEGSFTLRNILLKII